MFTGWLKSVEVGEIAKVVSELGRVITCGEAESLPELARKLPSPE
jgi:hypothetical protein